MHQLWNHFGKKCIATVLMMVVLCSLTVPAFAATETKAVETQAVTTAAAKKIVLIGDSRTANLRQSMVGGDLIYDLIQQDDKVLWDFKWGAKLYDMATNLVPRLELNTTIDKNTKIVVWMGYNDAVGTPSASVNDYIHYLNLCTALWTARGAKVYVMNVGPAGKKKNATDAQKQDYKNRNKKIRAFNKALKAGLSEDVKVLDCYGFLVEDGYATSDGTHYIPVTSRSVYKFVMKKVK